MRQLIAQNSNFPGHFDLAPHACPPPIPPGIARTSSPLIKVATPAERALEVRLSPSHPPYPRTFLSRSPAPTARTLVLSYQGPLAAARAFQSDWRLGVGFPLGLLNHGQLFDGSARLNELIGAARTPRTMPAHRGLTFTYSQPSRSITFDYLKTWRRGWTSRPSPFQRGHAHCRFVWLGRRERDRNLVQSA